MSQTFPSVRFPHSIYQKPCRASTSGIKQYVRHFTPFQLNDLDHDNDICMHDLNAESVENQMEADGLESVEQNFLDDGSLTSCTEIFEKLKIPYRAKRLIYWVATESQRSV